MPIIDNAVYVQGRRIEDPPTLDETFEYLHEHSGMAWIGLAQPNPAEIERLAAEFKLHPLAVEDALSGHQRAKLERYGEVLFAVLRPAHYDDASESVEFGEVHVFVGPDFVLTIRHGDSPDLGAVRQRMESRPELLALGPQAVLYAILDEIVDKYAPVAAGVQNDIDEIEDALFDASGIELSRRIYELSREVIAFQRATEPLTGVLETLAAGTETQPLDIELRRLLRDVLDHVARITDKLNGFRQILENALTVHSAVVTQHQTETALMQNEQVKKISGWAAILFGPSLVGTVYGMNFTHMPELEWVWGYPAALLLMAGTSAALYAIFKAKRWL